MKRIKVNGTIVSNDMAWLYDYFEMENTSPKRIEQELADANGSDVIIEINSGGGDVFSGSEIYTKIKSYVGKAIVEIVGLAGSAASVISQGGDVVKISPTAQVMIHNAAMRPGFVDKNGAEHANYVLSTIDESIANAYTIKTGKSKEEVLEMMNKETWMTANEALEHGFVDEIMFTQPTFANSVGFSLPENVIQKVKSDKKELEELRIENMKLRIDLLEKGAKNA